MSEPEGRAGLTDKLDADVRAAVGRIARVPQLLVACDYDGTLAPLVDDPTRVFRAIGFLIQHLHLF